MHIGINANLLSFGENYRQAGLSRYIDELLFELPGVLPSDRFTGYIGSAPVPVELQSRIPPNLVLAQSHFPTERAPVRIGWEQAVLPFASLKQGLDLLHCPVNVRPVWLPCPAVLTVHDLIFLRFPGSFHPSKRFYLSAMTGWSARHSRRVIAVSEATRRDVIELLRVDPRRVVTVYNGVGKQFRPLARPDVEEFRRRQALPDRMALYLGTLEPRKNLPMLLQAFHELREDAAFANTVLCIGGSKGWYYKEIFATAESLGFPKGAVRFLGRVPDEELPLWYNAATVFAYPSLYEGFGLPVLEAMACGTPAVVADASALPEVTGNAGILVEPENTGAWVQALKSLLSSTDRQTMSAAAQVQAAKFSWRRSAEETAAVYRAAVQPSKAKRGKGRF